MSTIFGALCNEYYVSSRLFLKLELTLQRETILHFFDTIRREFPDMRKFRRRDSGTFMLEEEPIEGLSRRWLRLDPGSLRFGYYAPPDLDAVRAMSDVVLEHAPYHLTFSDIDFDYLELIYGFDLEYRGNHDQLVAETLYSDHPFAGILMSDETAHIIECQPYFGIALTPECDLQAYVEVKSRTSSFEVRTGEYEPQPLSVFLTVRKYWGFGAPGTLVDAQRQLFERADDVAANKVVPVLVNPLAHAIASRS
ncbi:MAG TPA: hypothetical protein VGM03_05565 [Phycisphaerae bacterium]|jgi:hypothetical protein